MSVSYSFRGTSLALDNSGAAAPATRPSDVASAVDVADGGVSSALTKSGWYRVAAITASRVNIGSSAANGIGFGGDNYSVPLSSDGSEPATHWGMNPWVSEEFVGMLAGAGEGQMPTELQEAGFPPADFAAVMGALIVDVQPDMPGHFDEIVAANNLRVITEN